MNSRSSFFSWHKYDGRKGLLLGISYILFAVLLGLSSGGLKANPSDSTFKGDKQSLDYLRFLFHNDKDRYIPYEYLEDQYKNRIPDFLVKAYLPFEPVSNKEKGYYAGKVLVANDEYFAFAYDKRCFKGNLCRTRFLTILNHSGNIMGHTIMAYDSITRLKMDTMRGRIIQQRLIEKVGITVHYDIKETGVKKVKSKEKFHRYLKLTEKGRLIAFDSLSNSPDRKYHWSSQRLVQPHELDEFTTRELNILKNEIFADYQFRFPSERWKAYFSKKDWYKPRYDNVNDSLNLLERFNIKRIIRFQRNDS